MKKSTYRFVDFECTKTCGLGSWSEVFTSLDKALEALRKEKGWARVHLGDSYDRSEEETGRCAYPSHGALMADDGGRAPAIIVRIR